MRDAASSRPIASVRGLKVEIPTDQGPVRAVEGVDFDLHAGRTLCIVGESGSGKSMTARALLNQIPRPGRIAAGSVIYRGVPGREIDLATLDPRGAEIRAIRGAEIALVSQEPMAALSPVHTIGSQIVEAIRLHLPVGKREAKERAIEMMARVGIPRPADRFGAYPFEFSGGMRQRVCIAMALACEPKILVADEPTTALDVTTQATILDLLAELREATGMAVVFITHDLGVVAEIADEVAVMYLGRVAETAPVDDIFHDPRHPYTAALLRSVPKLVGDAAERLASIAGMVPSPFARPTGCGFRTRCPHARDGLCDLTDPIPESLGPARSVRCHRHAERLDA